MLEVLDALARVTGALPYAFMRSMFGPMLKQSTIPAQRPAELLAEFKRNRPSTMRKLIRAYLRDLRREPLIGDRLRALTAPSGSCTPTRATDSLTSQERRSLEDCPNVTVVTIPDGAFSCRTNTPPSSLSSSSKRSPAAERPQPARAGCAWYQPAPWRGTRLTRSW